MDVRFGNTRVEGFPHMESEEWSSLKELLGKASELLEQDDDLSLLTLMTALHFAWSCYKNRMYWKEV